MLGYIYRVSSVSSDEIWLWDEAKTEGTFLAPGHPPGPRPRHPLPGHVASGKRPCLCHFCLPGGMGILGQAASWTYSWLDLDLFWLQLGACMTAHAQVCLEVSQHLSVAWPCWLGPALPRTSAPQHCVQQAWGMLGWGAGGLARPGFPSHAMQLCSLRENLGPC